MRLTAADERPGATDAPGAERWSFRGRDRGLGLELAVIVELDPGGATYRAGAWRPGRLAVVVVAEGLARPRTGNGVELRGPGLWADHVIEEPGRRWTLGLEALAVALDPADGAGADPGPDVRGDPVPMGFDLDVEDDAEPVALADGYRVATRLRGEVLIGPERLEIDAAGHREHRRALDLGAEALLGGTSGAASAECDGSVSGA